MNKDTVRKLDELLGKMPKRDYDLDAWLSEDETAEFDRLRQMNTVLYPQETNTVLHGSERKVWRWVAAAACLLIIIGIGVTMKPTGQEPESKLIIAKNDTQPLPSLAQPLLSLAQQLPSLAQQLPSLEGRGVAAPAKATIEPTRGVATPTKATIEPRRGEAAPTNAMVAPRKAIAQVSQQDITADTLGSAIWQREENVVLALQLLSDCEQTIRHEEQELRNNIIRATFNATPQPAKARLLLNDNGDYMVVEDNGPVIIAL